MPNSFVARRLGERFPPPSGDDDALQRFEAAEEEKKTGREQRGYRRWTSNRVLRARKHVHPLHHADTHSVLSSASPRVAERIARLGNAANSQSSNRDEKKDARTAKTPSSCEGFAFKAIGFNLRVLAVRRLPDGSVDLLGTPLLNNRYRALELIGRGTFSTILLAEDESRKDKTRVALKVSWCACDDSLYLLTVLLAASQILGSSYGFIGKQVRS